MSRHQMREVIWWRPTQHALVAAVFGVVMVFSMVMATDNSEQLSCSQVRNVLASKQIGTSDLITEIPQVVSGEPKGICTSSKTCCLAKMEDHLVSAVKKDFLSLVQATSSYLKNLIATNTVKLQESLMTTLRMAETNTVNLFTTLYSKMAPAASSSVTRLFARLSAFIQGKDVDVEEGVANFFDSLFPLVYHHSLNPKLTEFSDDYKDCLRVIRVELHPFGDGPRRVGAQLSRVLHSARALLDALRLGVEVLNSTEHADVATECSSALVRLLYCPLCDPNAVSSPSLASAIKDTRACNGFCMNVLRGCLANVADLDDPWNEYVKALESLAASAGAKGALTVDDVTATLPTRISEAIMHAMVNGPELTKNVKKKCGHPQRSTRDVAVDPSSSTQSSNLSLVPSEAVSSASPAVVHSDLAVHLQSFIHGLSQSKGFYANLADTLCNDETLAVRSETDCWNGDAIGEYTKTIAGIGVSAQKYNPELKIPGRGDAKISQLVDKLKHIRQLLNARMQLFPESDSFLVNDGSGSGWNINHMGQPRFDDDEDYDGGSGDGGSGQYSDPSARDGVGGAIKPSGNRPTTDDIGFQDGAELTTTTVRPQKTNRSSRTLSTVFTVAAVMCLHIVLTPITRLMRV